MSSPPPPERHPRASSRTAASPTPDPRSQGWPGRSPDPPTSPPHLRRLPLALAILAPGGRAVTGSDHARPGSRFAAARRVARPPAHMPGRRRAACGGPNARASAGEAVRSMSGKQRSKRQVRGSLRLGHADHDESLVVAGSGPSDEVTKARMGAARRGTNIGSRADAGGEPHATITYFGDGRARFDVQAPPHPDRYRMSHSFNTASASGWERGGARSAEHNAEGARTHAHRDGIDDGPSRRRRSRGHDRQCLAGSAGGSSAAQTPTGVGRSLTRLVRPPGATPHAGTSPVTLAVAGPGQPRGGRRGGGKPWGHVPSPLRMGGAPHPHREPAPPSWGTRATGRVHQAAAGAAEPARRGRSGVSSRLVSIVSTQRQVPSRWRIRTSMGSPAAPSRTSRDTISSRNPRSSGWISRVQGADQVHGGRNRARSSTAGLQ